MKKAPKPSVLLTAALLLGMGLMTAVFALCSIAPFGSRSLGVLDMSTQYLSFLTALRDILAGRASFFYLPSLNMGGNMIGVAAYYLMSPLDLLTCLVPAEGLLTAVGLLYILRVGLASMTMALYAGRRHGWGWRVLLPGLAYGFMGYMTAYSINYLWQDCLILLPVTALGIARLAEGRSPWLYILSLAAVLVLNFYIGYIFCLFSVLFFLFELFTSPANRRRGRAVVTFGLGSLAAGALAAALLVPTFFVIMGGKAGFSLRDLSLRTQFSFPALFSKLFPGAFNYDELTPAGLPNIFSGSVSLALAVLYFASAAVPRRRKAALAGLLALLAVSFWIAGLDLIWHGMNVPAWYNYRYSFLFSFLIIAAGDRALSRLREGTRPWHLALPPAAVVLAGLLAFVGRSYPFITWRAALWTGAVTALVCGGLVLALRPDRGRRTAALLGAGLLAVHMADLGLNAGLSLDALTVTSSDPAKRAAYITEKQAAFDLVDVGDAFIRVESPDTFDMDRCQPMLFGYDGLSHFGSTIPVKNLEMFSRLGIPRYKEIFGMYGPDVTAGADSFLGVRYLVAQSLTKPYEAVAASGSYTVYEDPFALPIGWTADAAFQTDLAAPDCFAYIQGLYDAAAPEVDRRIYIPAAAGGPAAEGFADAGGGRYVLDGATSGTLTYTVAAAADGPLYGCIDIPDYPGVMVFVNGRYLAYYATGQANGSLYLGDFSAGDTVTVQVQTAVDITVAGAAFATEDAQALAAYAQAMAPGGCELTKLSGAHFTGSFTTGQGDALLVLTIPYDESWHITLDGGDAGAFEVQGCFTAIPVSAGEHTLEMRYTPAGLVPGCGISAGAAVLCLAVGLKKKKKT